MVSGIGAPVNLSSFYDTLLNIQGNDLLRSITVAVSYSVKY